MVTACCIAALGAQAQYGGRAYPHPNSILSTAKTCNLVPGFVMGGYQPNSTPADPNFVIDRTDIDGQLPPMAPPAQHFSMRYEIYDDLTCNSGPTNPPNPANRKFNCQGISVIETTDSPITPQVEAYALAGVYQEGVFFATLDVNGGVIDDYRWAVTTGVAALHPPKIIESVVQPHDYYICGDLGGTAYALKINPGMGPLWERIYPQVGEARGLIESPYAPPGQPELVVVGSQYNFDGYFMRIDAATGAVIDYNTYGTACGDDWFTSIERAFSNGGGSNGYIIGGRSLCSSIPGNFSFIPWMIKLDPNGAVIWSTLIQPTNPFIITAEINDVFERKSPGAETPYQYYGSAGCTVNNDDIHVWRLNDNGGDFGVFPNEFIYPLGAGNNIWSQYDATQLEMIGDGSQQGDGFQAWSTDYANNRHIFEKGYYNGVVSQPGECNEVRQGAKVQPGPGFMNNIPQPDILFPNVCPDHFQLWAIQNNVPFGDCAWAPTVPLGGSRNAVPTGIASVDGAEGTSGVYPNPVSGKALVSFNAADNSKVKIEVRNSLGQVVTTLSAVKTSAGSYQEEIDFESLGAKAGVYFVNVTIDNSTSSHRLVYIK